MKNLFSLILIPFLLFPAPSIAQDATPVCYTIENVHDAFTAIAKENGDDLDLVYATVLADGTIVEFWWKGGETVLGVIYKGGCYLNSEELTLVEFRELTGILLGV